jgi:uncharacterized protein
MADDPRRMLHPELAPEARRRLFLRGIELFNAGEYFECHEAFEEIWRSTTPEPRDLFQGLIQVAVGLYHFHHRNNPVVARRVLTKGRRRLRFFLPERCGLDLAALVEQVERWEAWLVSNGGEAPEVPRLVVVDAEAVR